MIRESVGMDKLKYCRFDKSHDHNTNECIPLKDEIEEIIKKDLDRSKVNRKK